MNAKWKKVAAATLALLIALAVALGVVNEPTQSPVSTPETTKVDGADPDRKADDTITLDQSAQEGLERIEDGKTAGELQEPLKQPGEKPEPLDGPLAAQEASGCRTAFVRNQSSRRGTRVRIIVWHQTVSRENGWSSQNALTAMANRPSSGVSWHKLIGRSGGRCTYTVPLTMKAWTQANANPFSIGYEVEAYGDEGVYVVGAGKEQLLRQTRADARRFGIPLQRGLVASCQVLRPGIIEHSDLGQCGGGHVDVTLTTNVQTDALIKEAARGNTTSTPLSKYDPKRYRLSVLTPGEKKYAVELLFRRRVAARNGGWSKVAAEHQNAANKAKRWLLARNVEIHRLGLKSRSSRHRVIHEVIAAK